MATGEADPNFFGTLVSNVVDVISLDIGAGVYEIVNIDGSARIDYTTDGSTPVVGGSPTGRVLPAVTCVDEIFVRPEGNSILKLISGGTPQYGVEKAAGPG